MKIASLLSILIGLNASAQIPTRVILKCQNAGQDRTLKIEETTQSYAITMTDLAEKELIGTSYAFKSPHVTATSTKLTVDQINGTKEHYSIEIEPRSNSEGHDSYVAVLQGWAPAGVVAAKEKVFRTLLPQARRFSRELLTCTE